MGPYSGILDPGIMPDKGFQVVQSMLSFYSGGIYRAGGWGQA